MSSRARPSSQLPKAPVHAHSSAVLSEKAVLSGTQLIGVGARAVLHPHSRILSTYSGVRIGAGAIVSERSRVGHAELPADSVADSLPSLDVTLGANVSVEPGASVAAMEVGEGTVVGAGASVGAGCVLGRHCRVAPKCHLPPGTLLPDYSVVYGDGDGDGSAPPAGAKRRDAGAVRRQGKGTEALRRAAHEKQVDALRKLIKSDFAKHGATIIDAEEGAEDQGA